MSSSSRTMLFGCPSIGTFVRPAATQPLSAQGEAVHVRLSAPKHPGHVPGISTRVRLGTLGEKTVSWIGSGATALPLPFKYRAVSASISSRIASVRPNANYSQS